jgi:hypothetical protein
MGEEQQHRRLVADDGRATGGQLAEQIIEVYGLNITADDVDELATDVTREIFERARTLRAKGLPPDLAIIWGHECVNGVQDHVLKHTSYLKVAAALVGVDPARVILPNFNRLEACLSEEANPILE